jgi:caspase 2
MEDRHRDLLRKQRVFILKNLRSVEMIVEHLYSSDVLTEDQKDAILLGKTTPTSQKAALLDTLPSRGPHAYEQFCSALKEEGYEFVVEGLVAAEANMDTVAKGRA